MRRFFYHHLISTIFVLAEWNLKEETLYIHFEKEQRPETIKEISFKVNQRSKERLDKILSN